MEATRTLLDDPSVERRFKEAWKSGSTVEIMESLPFFSEGATDDLPVWDRFRTRMESAYADVIQEAGEAAMKDINRKFGSNLRFTIEDQVPQAVDKADDPKKKRRKKVVPPEPDLPAAVPISPAVAVVPVNPYSIAWMRKRSLELVREGITKPQREVVQSILLNATSKGERATATWRSIKDNIGLTTREYRAVENRKLLLEAQGLGRAEVQAQAGKYRLELTESRARRIARTETIRAQSQGRSDSWRIAQEKGSLPEAVVRVWMAPPESSNPNRPCEVCIGLDGEEAPLNGYYESDIIGSVDGPPAHPNCRCTETIIRKEGKV